MLDPRIYRSSMIVPLLALILVAFSLRDPQGPLSTTLVPDAFGVGAYADMIYLARAHPDRRPGGAGDRALADAVAARLRALSGTGLRTSESSGETETAHGRRDVITVTATLPGTSGGSLAIIAPRDLGTAGGSSGLSATAALLGLARVLSGQTQQHTIILASTSASPGAGGVAPLLESLPRPVEAVIALGDLDPARVRAPVILPFAEGPLQAPPALRSTLAAALAAEGGPRSSDFGLGTELAHLALPLADGLEAPFNAAGIPAVELSLTGTHAPGGGPDGGPARLTMAGRAVLRTVDALDPGAVPGPSAYVLVKGKLVPGWAIRLLVLAFLLPVIGLAVDGAARAARRGFPVVRWILLAAAASLPPAAGLGVIVLARMIGGLPRTPPGLLGPGVVPFGGSETLVVLALILITGALAYLVRTGWRVLASAAGPGTRNPGAAAGVLLVACTAALGLWATNPWAALLVVPALHVWTWMLDPDLHPPRPLRAVAFGLGLLPPLAVAFVYARVSGLAPLALLWNGMLSIAAGALRPVALGLWCLMLGAAAGAAAVLLSRGALPDSPPVALTVRGPAGYAGPGSLGGTESALRR